MKSNVKRMRETAIGVLAGLLKYYLFLEKRIFLVDFIFLTMYTMKMGEQDDLLSC